MLAGKARRALDSTVLDDAVARQDTVTQLIAAVRRVGRVVPGAAELVAAVCTGYDYSRAGGIQKPDIAWDDAQARDELVSALVNDALALLEALSDVLAASGGVQALEPEAAQAVALLALVAGQDVEPAEDSDGTDGRWRIARRTAPDRVISTVDTDARHAHKTRNRRQDGFKAHVVVEPDTGLITATELTKAAGAEASDATVGIRLLGMNTTDQSPDQSPDQGVSFEVLADSAYGSGVMLAALERAGHAAVIKPWPLTSVIEGGFTIADFTVDEAAGTVTCPAGIVRVMTSTRTAYFKAACRDCPLRARCTTAAAGRTVRVGPHDTLQRAHRARAAEADFQAVYQQHRPMVERSIAWLTRGNRRLRYRGVTKNNAWLHLRVAAINLRRLLALGLHHHAGHWALAQP